MIIFDFFQGLTLDASRKQSSEVLSLLKVGPEDFDQGLPHFRVSSVTRKRYMSLSRIGLKNLIIQMRIFFMTTIVPAIIPIPSDSYKLCFLGAGKISESIARDVVKLGLLPASQIRITHLRHARHTASEVFGLTVLDYKS